MVLFRFLFAPVLLAVAVLSASPDRHDAPPPPTPGVGAAHYAVAPAERDVRSPAERDARAPALRAAPTRPATVP